MTAIAELFEPARSPLARAIGLWGPPGSGMTTALTQLSRMARLQGVVPIASELLTSFAALVQGRTLLVIDRTGTTAWGSLVDTVR